MTKEQKIIRAKVGLLERGIVVSYKTVRRWAMKFGRDYARREPRPLRARPRLPPQL